MNVSPELYTILKNLSIRERVRTIRMEIGRQAGDKKMYSTRAVCERVKVISYAALAAIERGDTDSVNALVLQELAKDFGISVLVFFDEYYENNPCIVSYAEKQAMIESLENLIKTW